MPIPATGEAGPSSGPDSATARPPARPPGPRPGVRQGVDVNHALRDKPLRLKSRSALARFPITMNQSRNRGTTCPPPAPTGEADPGNGSRHEQHPQGSPPPAGRTRRETKFEGIPCRDSRNRLGPNPIPADRAAGSATEGPPHKRGGCEPRSARRGFALRHDGNTGSEEPKHRGDPQSIPGSRRSAQRMLCQLVYRPEVGSRIPAAPLENPKPPANPDTIRRSKTGSAPFDETARPKV